MKTPWISRIVPLVACVVVFGSMLPSAARAADPFIRAGGESDPRLMLSMRTSFLYSTFSPALGFSVRLAGYTPVWNTARATGTVDVGLTVAYANGSKFLYPWIRDTDTYKTDGADHYTRVTLSLGHSFYFGQSRAHQFGVHFFLGAAFQNSTWSQEFVNEGLSGEATMAFQGLAFGPELEYTFRFHRHVGFHVVLGGAFGTVPTGPSGPMLHVGMGLTFYIR